MTRGIRWLGDGPGSGYGNASEDYISGLLETGATVSWTPLGWPGELWPVRHGPVIDLARHGLDRTRHAGLANREIEHDTVVMHSPPLWHERLAAEADGRALVAYTTWESDRLPPEWPAILDRYDRVLVPSEFNRQAFSASGVEVPIDVVPHLARTTLRGHPPLDAETARPAVPPGDGYVFYVIAPWTTRKAIPDLVAAYTAAFSARDEVTLIIHTMPEDRIEGHRLGYRGTHGHPPPATTWFALARLLAGRARPPRIVLSTQRLPGREVQQLHARGDCFVSLSRGEGWGLGGFEAGEAGNPVILTGWGGSLEYLPDGYPYLVDHDLVPTASEPADEWWYPHARERWARARIEHAAELLRHVHAHRDEARTWGALLQRHIRERFAAPVVTGQLLAALDRAQAHPERTLYERPG